MKSVRMGNIWNIVTFGILKLYETVKKVLRELKQSVAEYFFSVFVGYNSSQHINCSRLY